MKKIIALLVAVLFVLSVSSISFAYPQAEKGMPKAEEKKAEPEKSEKKAKVKQITGEVAAVDTAAKTITVKGKKAEVVISADEKMLADIKVGDKVVVKYAEQDGKNIAKSIKKSAAKAEKKAEEKAPKAEKEMKK
jgi:Cu/Ag efflux protein CusF